MATPLVYLDTEGFEEYKIRKRKPQMQLATWCNINYMKYSVEQFDKEESQLDREHILDVQKDLNLTEKYCRVTEKVSLSSSIRQKRFKDIDELDSLVTRLSKPKRLKLKKSQSWRTLRQTSVRSSPTKMKRTNISQLDSKTLRQIDASTACKSSNHRDSPPIRKSFVSLDFPVQHSNDNTEEIKSPIGKSADLEGNQEGIISFLPQTAEQKEEGIDKCPFDLAEDVSERTSDPESEEFEESGNCEGIIQFDQEQVQFQEQISQRYLTAESTYLQQRPKSGQKTPASNGYDLHIPDVAKTDNLILPGFKYHPKTKKQKSLKKIREANMKKLKKLLPS